MRYTYLTIVCVGCLACSVGAPVRGANFAEHLRIVDPDFDPNDGFASFVAVSDQYLLVGSSGFNQLQSPREFRGVARLYDVSTGDLLRTLPGPPLGPNDFFYHRVALAGEYALVGSPSELRDSNEPVHLYDAASGALLHTFGRPDGINNFFASELAMSGDRVLIASEAGSTAADEDSPPEVLLFDAVSGNLVHTFTNPAAGPTSGGFADHIGIDGDRIAIAAPFDTDDQGTDVGTVYVYNASTFDLISSFSDAELYGFDSLAIQGERLLVGTTGVQRGGITDGLAYLMDFDGNVLQEFDDPDPEADFLGEQVVFAGDRVLISSSSGGIAGKILDTESYLFDIATGDILAHFDNPRPTETLIAVSAAVSPSGKLVALGALSEGEPLERVGRVYVYAQVPEPHAMLLCVVAVGGLLVVRRRG